MPADGASVTQPQSGPHCHSEHTYTLQASRIFTCFQSSEISSDGVSLSTFVHDEAKGESSLVKKLVSVGEEKRAEG